MTSKQKQQNALPSYSQGSPQQQPHTKGDGYRDQLQVCCSGFKGLGFKVLGGDPKPPLLLSRCNGYRENCRPPAVLLNYTLAP